MIRLEHITKEFSSKNKKVTAVKDVSIHISKGEIYGIIGFSGAGKSTLIRCINLLETPTSGKVYFGNQELTSAGEKELRLARQKMGMIFQQFNLLEQRNVLKNICYPLELAGISKNDRVKRAKELLRVVDMEEKENFYVLVKFSSDCSFLKIRNLLHFPVLYYRENKQTIQLRQKGSVSYSLITAPQKSYPHYHCKNYSFSVQ